MTRLVVIGDPHFAMDKLEKVLEAAASEGPDAILVVGDLGSERDLAKTASRVLDELCSLGVPVAFVPGNHDLANIPDQGCATNVDRRVVTIAGLRIWGVGGAGPTCWGFPYEWTEDMLRQRAWHSADILLAHCPPKGTSLDRTASGESAGSAAIREILAAGHVRLMVCGHIHEAPGCERVEGVVSLNAGALGVPYGAPQYAVVDWGPESLEIRHVVLPYVQVPETALWCKGRIGGPNVGTRTWRFPQSQAPAKP